MKNEPSEFKLNQDKLFGIYRGVVEENDDSTEWTNDNRWEQGGTGRVQIRIWGIHTKELSSTDEEGIPTDELPWAEPAYPLIEGSISGVGLWSVPAQGTHVFVFFENGDHMQPRYFATVPGIEPTETNLNRNQEEGFKDPDGVYPKSTLMDEPDIHRLVRGNQEGTCWDTISEIGYFGNEGAIVCVGTGTPITKIYDTIYPNNMVLETHGGHVLEMDSTPEQKRMMAYHPADTTILIDNEGYINIHGDINHKGDTYHTGGVTIDDMIKGLKVIGPIQAGAGAHALLGSVSLGTCGGSKYPLVINLWISNVYDVHTHECPEHGTTSEPNNTGTFEGAYVTSATIAD